MTFSAGLVRGDQGRVGAQHFLAPAASLAEAERRRSLLQKPRLDRPKMPDPPDVIMKPVAPEPPPAPVTEESAMAEVEFVDEKHGGLGAVGGLERVLDFKPPLHAKERYKDPLHPDWTEVYDNNSEKYYYYHTKFNHLTRWDRPVKKVGCGRRNLGFISESTHPFLPTAAADAGAAGGHPGNQGGQSRSQLGGEYCCRQEQADVRLWRQESRGSREAHHGRFQGPGRRDGGQVPEAAPGKDGRVRLHPEKGRL